MKNLTKLTALLVLVSVNILTPFSYAVDDLEQVYPATPQSQQTEQVDVSESESGSDVDFSLDAQNDENGQESKNNGVLLGGKEVAEDKNPQTEDFYTEDDRNLQSSTSLNPASLDKEAQDDSLTKEINNNEDAEDLSELIPVEKGPMLRSVKNPKDWIKGEDFQRITISNPDDPTQGFTIMDRNLGAEEYLGESADETKSYGYHYQWGNNYGFSQSLNKDDNPEYFSGTRAIYDDYEPSNPYNNPVFRWGSSMYDYWQDNMHYDNLWGGGDDGDYSSTASANGFLDSGNDRSERQGPCPAGYHVPSHGERGLLIKYWAEANNKSYGGGQGRYYGVFTGFIEYFKLPFAGCRAGYDTYVYSQGSAGFYWSSSALMDNYLYIDSSYSVDTAYLSSNRASGYSVRCFKNEYKAPHSSLAISFIDDVSAEYVQMDTILVNWGDATVKKYMFTSGTECGTNPDDYTPTTESNLTIGGTEVFNGQYLCLYAENSLGASTIIRSANSIHIDMTSPEGTIQINNGVTYTNNANVTLNLNANDIPSGMGKMKFSCNGVTWSELENYTTSKSWNLNNGSGCTAGDGEKTVKVRFQDLAGNVIVKSASIVLDTIAPTGSVSLNTGAEYTNNSKVSLTLNADDSGAGVGQFRASCDANSWTSWLNYRISDKWEFGIAYGCNQSDGEKILYIEYKDNAGNISRFSDTIILDRVAPTGSIIINSGNQYTNNPQVSLSLDASDDLAGVSEMAFSCNKSAWTTWLPYKASDKWTFKDFVGCGSGDGEKILYVSYRDNAGNSSEFSTSITLDRVVPVANITTTNTLKSSSQTATLSCTDEVGVTAYYWGTSSSPTSYTTVPSTTSFTTGMDVISAGTYYLFCKDSAGNLSNLASQIYYSYEIHNMLNAVNRAEGNYKSENYPEFSFIRYIAPAGTTLTFANVYSIPDYSSDGQYKGYTTTPSGTPSILEDSELNSDAVYYFWFNRTKYDLTLIKNTGIKTIHYKVNGGDNYLSVLDTTIVPIKAGSDAYVYAIADTGFEYNDTSLSNPKLREKITAPQTFSPISDMLTYTIVWKNSDGTVLETDENVRYGEITSYDGPTPTKTSDALHTYTFVGWNPAISEIVVGDAEYVAVYNSTRKGYSGGGGRKGDTTNKNQHQSADEITSTITPTEDARNDESDMNNYDSKYTQEENEAYNFAHKNGITTMPTIQKSAMNSKITRIEMAKMLSQYAMNVLGKQPDISKGVIKFNDVTEKMDRQYDNGVTLAYQLGIMGQNMKNNRFRPNDEVTRAEFATALSRLLYSTSDGQYKSTKNYYELHMNKLKKEGIITNDNPNMKELRGYIMIMLMRSAK